ncbi:MAG: A/G-specific adenine glycosylase [Methanoregula sp.]|jgi:A/G-specific adenine glycosylase|uniref:A/G-specific adenine glycosylase n=1 Tax=Methanoregula sp. TaxID=2052170 RepID=UPI003D10DFF8
MRHPPKNTPVANCQSTPDTAKFNLSGNDSTIPSIPGFQRIVLSHYEQYGRTMPWRSTPDPYPVLVSEIMLQQTQVDRVMAKFPAFIFAFPDFASLAAAPIPDVLAAWQGLGYNRRALALRNCAEIVMSRYGGVLPADPGILSGFPGIGHATASSICAFAFNMPVVFIETNIRRVFIHHFFPGTGEVSDSEILPLVEQALYRENPRVWYWALMDLGTALKKVVPNPNRRRRHYARQSAFEGSDRQVRGMVLRLLLAKGEMAQDEIAGNCSSDKERVLKVLAGLERDGFIRRKGEILALSSGT